MTTPDSSLPSWDILSGLDTTQLSLLHWSSKRYPRERAHAVIAYVASVSVTYVPLAVAAVLSLPALDQPYQNVTLPFLWDWNVMFMFLVAMPSLVAFTVVDNRLLATSLCRIVKDDIVSISEADATALRQRWEGIYGKANIVAQSLGFAVGLTLAWSNHAVYSAPPVGYWMATSGHVTSAGWVFIYCIFAYYAVLPVYILRSIIAAFFLHDLVTRSTVRLVPFHPDHCGGLRPVGSLGLRNQYLLSIYGLNLVSLVYVSERYLKVPEGLKALMIIAAIAYVTFGPLVFLAPLIPFRAGMLRNKAELMSDVAQRMRMELTRIREKLRDGIVTKEDEELIQRLRGIGTLIEELPVWPFDARTLRRFLTAYGLPLLGSVGVPLLKSAGKYLIGHR